MLNLQKTDFLEESSPKIKQIIKSLLISAGVGDQLPTPKEDIVACAKLAEIGKLDLSSYQENWFGKGYELLKSALSKIRALLDFKREIIYISPETPRACVLFATYHEVTHKILPWHRGLYNPHLDYECSLNPIVAKGLEVEANYGAALLQFQIDRFKREIRDYPLGLETAIYFAKKYGTSFHSTFHQYTADNNSACALLVFNIIQSDNSSNNCPLLKLGYYLQSEEFTKEFGYTWSDFYRAGSPIYDTVFSISSEKIKKGEITLGTVNGFTKNCQIDVFSNNYSYFVLIYPIKKSILGRKKLIIIK